MMLLGSVFPNFKTITREGEIDFHDWMGTSWGILFSHPADFTPVCTTELALAAELKKEFHNRDVKLMALSLDSLESHNNWQKDINFYRTPKETNDNDSEEIPITVCSRELAASFGMLDPEEIGSDGLPLTARAVFIISPDKKLKASILYPATTGRNFTEILRLVDSLQLTQKHKIIATPANWTPSREVVLCPGVDIKTTNLSESEVAHIKLPSNKDYLRFIKSPKSLSKL